MKIYLAARYSRHPELQAYTRDLQAHGFEVTSRWLWGDHEIRAQAMGYLSATTRRCTRYGPRRIGTT
jgi:hypothetical protein